MSSMPILHKYKQGEEKELVLLGRTSRWQIEPNGIICRQGNAQKRRTTYVPAQ